MFGISMWELLIVGLILFLVVGPAKLPGLAKSLGKGIKDLRKNLNEVKGTVDKDDEFVKAVSDARRTVAEARQSIRSIFDDVTEPLRGDESGDSEDPAPKPVPRGRPLVRAAADRKRKSPARGRNRAVPSREATAPALADKPVEAEVWRSRDAAESETSAQDAAERGMDRPEREGLAEWTRKATVRGSGEAAASAAPVRPARTPGKRRMVRPGRRSVDASPSPSNPEETDESE